MRRDDVPDCEEEANFGVLEGKDSRQTEDEHDSVHRESEKRIGICHSRVFQYARVLLRTHAVDYQERLRRRRGDVSSDNFVERVRR